MPHSSGGGHCGGGCHSGGYGGGSSRPMHRYFYHTPNGIKSLMAVEEPSENELRRYKTDLTILITTLSVIAAILLLVICFMARPKTKLPLPNNSESVVIDNLDLLSDNEMADLLKSCDNFRDKTGIPVEIYIDKQGVISDNERYLTLQNFAYNEYVKSFKDERHWLIAYAVTNGARFSPDWQFEGMQGNDTDPILTESLADKFNKELYANLKNGLSVSASFIKALDHASTYMVGAWDFSSENCVFAIMTLFALLTSICIAGIRGYYRMSKMKEYLTNKASTLTLSNGK